MNDNMDGSSLRKEIVFTVCLVENINICDAKNDTNVLSIVFISWAGMCLTF